MFVLQEFSESLPDVDAVLNAAEIYWICELRRRGCPLTNLTVGGEGTRGRSLSSDARARISRAKLGKPLSAEHRAKMAEAQRQRPSFLGCHHSPEARAKISAAVGSGERNACFGSAHSAETRARCAEAQRGERNSFFGRRHSAETRSGMSEANRGEKNPNSRLTHAEIVEIRERYSSGAISQQQLADQYGVCQVSISRIVRGAGWQET